MGAGDWRGRLRRRRRRPRSLCSASFPHFSLFIARVSPRLHALVATCKTSRPSEAFSPPRASPRFPVLMSRLTRSNIDSGALAWTVLPTADSRAHSTPDADRSLFRAHIAIGPGGCCAALIARQTPRSLRPPPPRTRGPDVVSPRLPPQVLQYRARSTAPRSAFRSDERPPLPQTISIRAPGPMRVHASSASLPPFSPPSRRSPCLRPFSLGLCLSLDDLLDAFLFPHVPSCIPRSARHTRTIPRPPASHIQHPRKSQPQNLFKSPRLRRPRIFR